MPTEREPNAAHPVPEETAQHARPPSSGLEPAKGQEAPPPLLAVNGDVVVELLLSQLQRSHQSLLGIVRSDKGRGIELVRQGRVLASGWHGPKAPQHMDSSRYVFLDLVKREVGLASRAAPVTIEQLKDLSLASRPDSAGVRTLFDRRLREAGIHPELRHQRAILLESHLEVVCAVASGQADAGITSSAWAHRLGLAFHSLGWETYGLVMPVERLSDPRMIQLCEAAQSPHFRRLLNGIQGYDAQHTGSIRFDPPAGVDEPSPLNSLA